MFCKSTLIALSLAQFALAVGPTPGSIRNLVTFGDSYTYLDGASDGGTLWPQYAAGYGNLTLHSYAANGAVCDQSLTPRPDPGILQDEIPAYLNDTTDGLSLDPGETVYTLWIGTNDLGYDEIMSGGNTPGTTIVNTSSCAMQWMKTLYEQGARNFIYQNVIPLNLVIMYQADGYLSGLWPIEHNGTQWNLMMTQLVAGANEIAKFMLQQLAPTLTGAHIGLFDSHGLFQDIHDNPADYLNGTAPFNVTGCAKSCPVTQTCTIAEGSDKDSFMWYDELHPSEQSQRWVAKEMTESILGAGSRWMTWLT